MDMSREKEGKKRVRVQHREAEGRADCFTGWGHPGDPGRSTYHHLTIFIEEDWTQTGEAASQGHSGSWQGWNLKSSPYICKVVDFLWRENLGLFANELPSNLG